MIRVAQVVSGMPRGGAERVVVELVRRAPPDMALALFCLDGEGPLHQPVRAVGTPVCNLGKPPGFRPGAALQLARRLAAFAPVVVHSHLLPADLYTALAARALPARRRPALVSTVHSGQPWRGRLERRLALALCRRQAAVITVSPQVEQVLAQAGVAPGRMACIPPGVDVQALAAPAPVVEAWRQKLGLVGVGPVVGTVGRLSPEKGHRFLISACRDLRRAHPGLRLLLVGEGGEQPALERQAARELPGACLFAGAHDQVGPLLALMDVFCLPSLYEGLPLALLEAMALARPVVATAVGGVPGLVGPEREGLLVPPGEVPALAAALGRLLGEPALARRVGSQAAKLAACCSAQAMAEAHYQLYRRLAAGRN